MKKITLLLFLVFFNYSLAQTWSTGPETLITGYTVQFDVDTSSDLVTLTMIWPDNVWLGVGPGIVGGLGMGNLGDDAIVFNNAGLEDRNMPGGVGQPNYDLSQDWTVVSNTISGSTRTLVATRARDTGDSNDFVFPSSGGALPILWARGSSLSFGYHGTNRGGIVANLTLSGNKYELSSLKITPNPVDAVFKILMPNKVVAAKVEVYDVIGQLIVNKSINSFNDYTINSATWNSGVYLVRILTDESSIVKRIIKN